MRDFFIKFFRINISRLLSKPHKISIITPKAMIKTSSLYCITSCISKTVCFNFRRENSSITHIKIIPACAIAEISYGSLICIFVKAQAIHKYIRIRRSRIHISAPSMPSAIPQNLIIGKETNGNNMLRTSTNVYNTKNLQNTPINLFPQFLLYVILLMQYNTRIHLKISFIILYFTITHSLKTKQVIVTYHLLTVCPLMICLTHI